LYRNPSFVLTKIIGRTETRIVQARPGRRQKQSTNCCFFVAFLSVFPPVNMGLNEKEMNEKKLSIIANNSQAIIASAPGPMIELLEKRTAEQQQAYYEL
jgi:hypothetical protein